jgi:ubiquitin carboxyl-terminal hydrolase 25
VSLKQEIEQAYSKLNSVPYHLHAICVHDGNAESGHYFTFIKDHSTGKWLKFNDIRVSEVTEEEVIHQSQGGHS